MNKSQDIKFIYNQLNEIKRLNEAVKIVIADLETGFELYGENIYNCESLKGFTEKLRSIKKFLLEYNKEFWRINAEIEKLNLNNDMIGKIKHECEVLKDETIKLDDEICALLVKFYKSSNISNISTESIDDYITKITVKVKGIPDWILEEVQHDEIVIEELEYNASEEYVYEIYLLCEKDRIIDGILRVEEYLHKCIEKMTKLYDYKEMILNDLERELGTDIDEEDNHYKLKDVTLYNWQEEAYEAWKINNYRGIFKVATGCGKTIFALSCLQRVIEEGYNVRVVIIVSSIALQNQWEEVLKDTFHVPAKKIGRVGDGKKELRTFTIYINYSAQKYLETHLRCSALIEPIGGDYSDSYYFVIADECHRYGSDNNLDMLNCFNEITKDKKTNIKFFSIGLSATPEQTNPMKTRELEKRLGNIIYEYDLIRAIDEGIIATPIINDIRVDFTSEEFKKYKISKERFEYSKDDFKEVLDRLHKNYEEDFLIYLAYDIIQNKKYKKIIDYVKSKKKEFKDVYNNRKPQWLIEFNDWYNENVDDDMEIAWSARNLTVAHQAKQSILYGMGMREKELINNMDIFKGHRVIIFAERIDDVDEKIYKILKNKYCDESVVIYNSNDKRGIKEEVINKFKSGIANILIAVEALDEGIDVPKADMAFVFQGNQDERQQIQRLGRIIRKSKKSNYGEDGEGTTEYATLINLFCPTGGENIYLAKFFKRMIIRYRENGYGELQDTYKRGLKALGYDMDVELKQLKNYEYLRIEE
ncbi:DEAD/DEAH box helicase family protein [Acetivibrio thermocellus]|uniref:DEAD/DEAH box helicase n=1 Tax=Acetivibrio thermocellus TaxID=1515 RepID=UPI0010A5C852|nr:DEAD/DEAH box helicase family protein [Acetivibrio thermocellus]THJ78293.1 DEAD/DEAH box helicase [Acetivibrio thermocellus]